MHAQIPFKAQLLNGKIVLSGDLDDSREVRQECERVAKAAAQQGSTWVVDAQKAQLPVGGEETWSQVAQEFLSRCRLVYVPSQLAQNLEYDDQYKHKNSTFLETDEDAAEYFRNTGDSSARRAVPAY
jgi:hypothetical protein